MPAAYTHFRFGQDVLEGLSEELNAIVSSAKEFYDMGLYGPDLFFYRHATFDPISRFGFRMHKKDAYDFFQKSLRIVKTEQDLAYMFGFLCHFELDRACHTYIAQKERNGEIKHLLAEAELDRTMLIADGANPFCYPAAQGLVISVETVHTVRRFFPEYSEKRIRGAMRDMKLVQRFLSATNDGKRVTLQILFAVTGLYPVLYSLVIRKRPNPRYIDCCRDLRRIYASCEKRAVELLEEYYETWVCEGRLSARFHGRFSGE